MSKVTMKPGTYDLKDALDVLNSVRSVGFLLSSDTPCQLVKRGKKIELVVGSEDWCDSDVLV